MTRPTLTQQRATALGFCQSRLLARGVDPVTATVRDFEVELDRQMWRERDADLPRHERREASLWYEDAASRPSQLAQFRREVRAWQHYRRTRGF